MVYLPGNEATRTVMNWNKWRSQLSRDEIAEYLTKTDHKKCKNTQNIHIARWALNLSTFWGVSSRKKNIFLYPEIGQSFEESTRGDKLVKYLPDIFIEFGFCMMWRIIQILEAVIYLGLITFSSICIILYIILSSVKSSIFAKYSLVSFLRSWSCQKAWTWWSDSSWTQYL